MKLEHNIEPERLDKEFKCYKCHKEYVRKKQLEDHIIAEHFEIRFPCDYCDNVYKYQHLLLRHLNRRHKEKKFDYETLLKEGKDHWKIIVENKVALDTLPEDTAHAVRQYLKYLESNKVAYGDDSEKAE